jgi:hypothetical protein
VSRSLPAAALVAAAATVAILILVGERHSDRSAGASAPWAATDPRLPIPSDHIVGYVRDVNGRPVAGATVRLADGDASVEADDSGRFELAAQSGRHPVVAQRSGYTSQSVTTDLGRAEGARVDFALAVTDPGRVAVANSADRLIFWTSCDRLAALSDAQVRTWIARGVDGFVCESGSLFGLGGDQRFTPDAEASLDGAQYRLQRTLRRSAAVRAAKAGRLSLYLAFYMTSYYNRSTPLADWFDDGAWARKVLPRVRDLAAAARSMSFAGLAVDQELYPQVGGHATASWAANYPGNVHPEAQVRAKVRERGRELMQAMVQAYPGLELVAYDTRVPESWQAKVAADINHTPNAYLDQVQLDLWDGLTSVQGYSAIRWMDAIFYKTFHLPGASWDRALQYNANRIAAFLSRRLSNWYYASSRLHVSPFSWIDAGPAAFDRARDPAYVAQQLAAFRRWGSGGAFANYAYADLGAFDYRPYVNAMRQASSPARIDTTPPKIALVSPPAGTGSVKAGQTITLRGVASDDYAVQAVDWIDDRGRQGAARMSWRFTGDQRSGWHGQMDWSIERLTVPPDAGHLTITAQDIHGLATRLQLAVTG